MKYLTTKNIIITLIIALIVWKRRQIWGLITGKPRWITIAEGEVGTSEIVGSQHNPRVVEYHSTTGGWGNDEVAWCSSFVNWVMKKAGHKPTGSAQAISWSRWGKKLDRPAYGAIAVFSYGGGKGHVGFIVGKKGDKLLILGGNQSNTVKVSSFGKSQIIAYVVPTGYDVPESAYDLKDGTAAAAGSTR
jgi:uncharacterized protein (TIGR02594 family)